MTKINSVKGYGIGNRIREARKSLDLRQSDLSAATGLPASHLSDIEREVITPTIPTLHKIGQALNRPIEYFLQQNNGEPRSIGMVVHRTPVGGQVAARLAQLVEFKTGGDIKLRIYHNAAEVTARDMIEGLVEGSIHIYIDEPLGFERYADLCGPVFLPYFFRDRAQYHRFLRSTIFVEHIYQKLIDNGIRLLNPASNWVCGSFEVLFSTEPIFTPDDLVGRRFRSYDSDAAIALRRALGAEPVLVEWEVTFEAFEKGLIDTFIVPSAHFYALKIHKLAKYATFLSPGYTLNMTVAISDREYHKLSPTVQQVLIEAIEETGTYCSQLTGEQTASDLEFLSDEHGLPVIHPDQEIWRNKFASSIRQICDEGLLDRELYKELQSL
jgi:TRAP-type C4-dicarboxylate transport system substrate-binding protein